MQLFFTLVEDQICRLLEIYQEEIFHFVCYFVQESSHILVGIVIVKDPSQSFIDSDDKVMEIVLVSSIIQI